MFIDKMAKERVKRCWWR